MNPFTSTASLKNFSPQGPLGPVIPTVNTAATSMWNGRPYKGKLMNIKNSDAEKHKPVLKLSNPRARVFLMELAVDVEEYVKVMQDCINMKCQVNHKEIITHGDQVKVYLEWYESYYTNPEK